MTSDGVPKSKWDHVHQLAVDIANAASQEDAVLSEARTEELHCYLQELRSCYGDLPSILGTQGDHTEDESARYDLYARGIAEARRIGDEKNLVILLESILELECLDADQRVFWEAQLKAVSNGTANK